jgi:hypothetical protein
VVSVGHIGAIPRFKGHAGMSQDRQPVDMNDAIFLALVMIA